MKKTYLILLVYIILVTPSCTSNPIRSIEVSEFSKDQFFDLNVNEEIGKRNVERINILISGHLDDTAKIGRYFILPGNVDTFFTHEWYGSDYQLRFMPYNSNGSNLKILLEFDVL